MDHIRGRRPFVGSDVHIYDASYRASQYRSQIPSMRATQDTPAGSGTPIYDTLYSEYRRQFRTLPGDRAGEDSLRFTSFAQLHNDSLSPLHRTGGHREALPAALPPGSGLGSSNRMHGIWFPERA
jgi:hypothetical protein